MAVSPNTIIKLLKVPIEIDNFNQLKFASKQAQFNYFNSLPHLTAENLSYQRKDNFIWFPEDIDNILQYNYCMYQNSNYSNKWFYAFITNMEYENDGTTRIYIETDVFQTWQFDIIYKPSFVEREHTNNDTIGNNLIPENLQLGEYTCNKKLQWLNGITGSAYTGTNLVIVLGATENNEGNLKSGVQADGIYAGLRYYVFHNTSQGIIDLNNWLEDYAERGTSDAIQCMFIMPEFLTVGADRQDHLYAGSNTANTKYINHGEESIVNKNLDLTNTDLDGYVPKNNKLKTFPYSYLLVSNNSGTDVVYRYENFFTINDNEKQLVSNPQFKVHSCITPSGSIRMIPENYKGIAENDIEGINMGKFPICSWNTDVYTNWLTQNGVNIGLSIAGSTVSAVAGAMTGNAIGVASGILGIANTLGEIYKESLMPNQSEGNINSGDVITATGNNDFHFQVMSIKKEYAKIIDDFFSMYGYKTNEVKFPNITGRRNWNYIKTININLEGNIPQFDLQKIKEIFNNGVTLWHNSSTFLDYSQNNDII